MDLIGMFACGACATLYPTQLKFLCTPAYKIPERYPGTSVEGYVHSSGTAIR